MTSLFFSDQLITQIQQKHSIICVGLDPRCEGKEKIPSFLLKEANNLPSEAIWQFNRGIIDATFSFTPIYKPQIAFFEQYDALDALKKTINYIHSKGALVILDAKRNDIGSTAEAYAKAVFDLYKADAVTVNGYLGVDGILPFCKYIPQGKGIFVLLKTSNKSSEDFQDLFTIEDPRQTAGRKEFTLELTKVRVIRNYIMMARLLRKWAENPEIVHTNQVFGESGYSSLGGVVGATYPAELENIRQEIPHNFILIPGYGAQGGTVHDIITGINNDGLGAIVNASRSINYAYLDPLYKNQYSEDQFAEAAHAAVKMMQETINNIIYKEKKHIIWFK